MFTNNTTQAAQVAENAALEASGGKDNSAMWGFFGNVVQTGGNLWGQLNPKIRENELAIAQANAQAATANAQAISAQPRQNIWITVAIVIVILVIAFMLFSKSNSNA